MLNKKSLLNRTLVGVFIAVFMVGTVIFDLAFTDYPGDSTALFGLISGRTINSVLFAGLIVCAVVEMRRAVGFERIPDCFSWILWTYGIGLMPAYGLFGYTGIVFFTLLVFALATLTALKHHRADSLMYIAFVFVYPGLTMASLLYINRCASTQLIAVGTRNANVLPYIESDIWYALGVDRTPAQLLPFNAIGLALVFAVSSFTDIFAYLFGGMFGKHKLCPAISPNKTVEGAIGGVLGGLFGALVVFFVFDFGYVYNIPSFQFVGEHFGLAFQNLSHFNLYLSYALIGSFGAVMTQIGDLLASVVKRYVGIKDYSRVLGEHGGIMDRFDGIMLNSLFVAIVYMFII